MKIQPPTLFVIVPCYNEEGVIDFTAPSLSSLLTKLIQKNLISGLSRIYFIDDGSADRTWDQICERHYKDSLCNGIRLSTNVGHQNALMAGMISLVDRADVYVSIDADLQDDPSAIESFIKSYMEGSEIVYGVRDDRTSDSFLKKETALLFYRLASWAKVDLVHDHAEFRLFSNSVLRRLKAFDEVNLFLRAIFPKLSRKTSIVYYKRGPRVSGTSKYDLSNMLSLALQGITSFSSRPLRMITIVGVLSSVVTASIGVWLLYSWLLDHMIPTWLPFTALFLLYSSLQIICLGIIAEYLGNIYLETKRRPRYFIEELLEEKIS